MNEPTTMIGVKSAREIMAAINELTPEITATGKAFDRGWFEARQLIEQKLKDSYIAGVRAAVAQIKERTSFVDSAEPAPANNERDRHAIMEDILAHADAIERGSK